jgi:hypothetical protein
VTERKVKDEQTPEDLTEHELDEANGEPLPERHALTLIRGSSRYRSRSCPSRRSILNNQPERSTEHGQAVTRLQAAVP